MKYYLAIDIGASSGRHIVGWRENGEIKTDEVYRFSNYIDETDEYFIWDIKRIAQMVDNGVKAARDKYKEIESISVDTWGVDYVLMRDDEVVYPCVAYRDSRTDEAIKKVHEIIPEAELYAITGIQSQPFNTIYQLYADKLAGRLSGVTDFLLLPEYFIYHLTGVKAKEYTIATTTGLVNAKTRKYDLEIIERLGLPKELFGEISQPKTVLKSKPKCVLCAMHDTASAVESIPMEGDALFLSSGTWSLLGVKLKEPLCDENSRRANLTNEGGVGYYRYLKNIMGLWIIQRLKEELCKSFEEMVKLAQSASDFVLFDVNAPCFSMPENMRKEVENASSGEMSVEKLLNSVCHSLADSYRVTIEEIERNTGKTYDKLYIVGGGAKNAYLTQLTEEYTEKEVIALPIEATSIGNLKIQMEADE